MLPSGAALVPTLPPAPADRPEATEPDASDSRFASLMAQFVPSQAPVPVPSQAAPAASPAAPAASSPAAPAAGPAGGGDRAASAQAPADSASAPASGPGAPKAAAASPDSVAPELPAADASSQAPATADPSLPVPTPAAPQAPSSPITVSATAAPSAFQAAAPASTSDPAPAPDPDTGLPPSNRTLKASLLLSEPQAMSSQAAGGRTPVPSIPTAAPAALPNATAPLAGTTPTVAAPHLPVIAAPGSAPQASAAVPPASGPVAAPGQPATPAGAAAAITGTAPAKPDEGLGASQEALAKADASTTTFQVHLHPEAGIQAAATARPVQAAEIPAASSAPPSAPAATTPVATPPVAQVDSSMKWMLRSGAQEARLQLHPDSLGQVTIHLRVEGGEVHAKLWVSEPASVQAVQEGRPHLELSLKEQGLQLGSFDLQQGHRPFQEAASTQTFGTGERTPAPQTRQESPAALVPTSSNPHQIELYA